MGTKRTEAVKLKCTNFCRKEHVLYAARFYTSVKESEQDTRREQWKCDRDVFNASTYDFVHVRVILEKCRKKLHKTKYSLSIQWQINVLAHQKSSKTINGSIPTSFPYMYNELNSFTKDMYM